MSRRLGSASKSQVLTLSVLDQSPVPTGCAPADAIPATVALAQACERLGYHRYWLAEHHNDPALAGTAPEVLVSIVAANTARMRVGSGGVMLSHYSPFKVAETFAVLEAAFPGRIDLGIGRALGSDHLTAAALRFGAPPIPVHRYSEQIRDLVGFIRADLIPGHPLASIRAMPRGRTMPEIWLLGSSEQSAEHAAQFGLPYAYAHFISPDGALESVERYKREFQPSGWLDKPRVAVATSVFCADDHNAAERLAAHARVWRQQLNGYEPGPPDFSVVKSGPVRQKPGTTDFARHDGDIVGSPQHVCDELRRIAQAYGATELFVVTACDLPEARLRSYELVATIFGLRSEGERRSASRSYRRPTPSSNRDRLPY
jgi:luciferase family oxidoreductase group 1